MNDELIINKIYLAKYNNGNYYLFKYVGDNCFIGGYGQHLPGYSACTAIHAVDGWEKHKLDVSIFNPVLAEAIQIPVQPPAMQFTNATTPKKKARCINP